MVTWWGVTGAGEGDVSSVPGKTESRDVNEGPSEDAGKERRRRRSPADMAMVVPATIPMATPLWRLGGMCGAYMAAGIPLGWTTVV